MNKLELKNLSYTLKDFNLEINSTIEIDQITAIIGKSGSAKTTLLRCICGISKPSSGEIIFNDKVWQNDNTFIPAHQRSVGLVFQEANLFSHLSVKNNLEYAFKRNHLNNPFDINKKVKLFKIEHLLKRFPHELSGGERQKVAIARAILANPQLLLMDEPLASIDETSKIEIINFLNHLYKDFNIPILYVSHSTSEIQTLARNVITLKKGKINHTYRTKNEESCEISSNFPNS